MAFSTDDTIVAIATPPGRGGIGVVRISGVDALRVAAQLTTISSLEPRRATLTIIHGATLHDQAIVTFFPRPGSYTGEDVVEVSAHGSPVVLRSIVRAAILSSESWLVSTAANLSLCPLPRPRLCRLAFRGGTKVSAQSNSRQ